MNASKRRLSVPALLLGLMAALPTFAQGPATISPLQQRPVENQETPAKKDPLDELQLTGEQRAAIRAIRIANRDEQMAINQRLRQANRALDDALDADNPNEAAIEQLAKELAEVQSAAVRLRVQRELRIRRVFTPAQQALLREIRHRAAEANPQKQQRIQNQDNDGRRPRNRSTQGNSVAPTPRLRPNNLLRP